MQSAVADFYLMNGGLEPGELGKGGGGAEGFSRKYNRQAPQDGLHCIGVKTTSGGQKQYPGQGLG
jgi:hypothetical protein